MLPATPAETSPLPEAVPDSSALSFAPAFAALVLGAIAMGVSPVFVRFAEVGPMASAFWRVLLALPLLMVWALIEQRRSRKSGRSFVAFDAALILAGLFFTGDLFFWHLAIVNTSIANATLLACLAPVWVALLSGWFIGEKVPPIVYAGLALSLGGSFLLIGASYRLDPTRLTGDLYGVATSLFFGLYFLAVRVARRRHGAGAVIFSSTIITTIALFAITLVSAQSLVPQTLAGVSALLALGIISHSGGQGLLAVALGSLSASFSSMVIFIEALAAALFGWLIFAERLGPGQIAGGLLILAGIWIARPRQASRLAHSQGAG
jgi:drug/metabolite transporter (DMT)-like permease